MKHTMVVLTLSLLVLKLWAGTIIDDFEDGDFNGWRSARFHGGERSEWVVKNGELVFTAQNFCRTGSALGIGDETWIDYEFSAQFSLRKTFPICSGGWLPAIGIGIHSNVAETGTMRPEKNQWVWTGVINRQTNLGNDGWNRKQCEVWLPPVYAIAPNKGEFATKPRRWYTLRLIANIVGNLTVYRALIDEKLLCDFDIETPLKEGERLNTGGAFLYVRNAEVRFDNVVISGETIPDLDMNEFVALSVSPGGKLTTMWGELRQHR